MRTHSSISLFVMNNIIGGTVLAECPSKLPPELMYDCIVREGAGSTYNIEGNLVKWKAGKLSIKWIQVLYAAMIPNPVLPRIG